MTIKELIDKLGKFRETHKLGDGARVVVQYDMGEYDDPAVGMNGAHEVVIFRDPKWLYEPTLKAEKQNSTPIVGNSWRQGVGYGDVNGGLAKLAQSEGYDAGHKDGYDAGFDSCKRQMLRQISDAHDRLDQFSRLFDKVTNG